MTVFIADPFRMRLNPTPNCEAKNTMDLVPYCVVPSKDLDPKYNCEAEKNFGSEAEILKSVWMTHDMIHSAAKQGPHSLLIKVHPVLFPIRIRRQYEACHPLPSSIKVENQ